MKKFLKFILLAISIEMFMCSSPAWADHPRLDEAARLIGEASFEDALEALAEVEGADHLTRDEVLRLLVLLSLVHHALGNEPELDSNLTALASIEPDHTFASNVPPTVQARFETLQSELEGPLDLEVEGRRIRGGFQIDARIQGDDGDLVEETQIYARLPGGEWVQTEGRTASIPVRGEGAVEYYVVALGPGGAVLLTEGTEFEPLLIGTAGDGNLSGDPSGDPATTVPPVEDPEARERRAWPWALLGTGIAAIIVGAVVAGVLVSRQNQGTQLDAPTVDWP